MNQVHIYNLSKVQKAVKGTDGKVYYLPPRTVKPLPKGGEVEAGLDRYTKVTYKES